MHGERPPSAQPLVTIRDLRIHFRTRQREFCALHGVDLDVRRGEALGLVGESGSGKSITWLAILGLLGGRARISGTARLDGADILNLGDREMSRIRGRRIAMIFQDASSSLNPVQRIGTQLMESLRVHRDLAGDSARAEAVRLLDMVQFPNARQRLREYPHQLSGGLNQRVMIAIALAAQPDLLIADEPTTALDATVQAQILGLLDDLRRNSEMAMVLISHDFGVVAECCDRVAVMYAGRVVEEAGNPEIFAAPAHPYTAGLIGAMPDAAPLGELARPIPGSVPEPWNMPSGCVFRPRCTYAIDACADTQPLLGADLHPDHRAACLRKAELSLPTHFPMTADMLS